MLETHVPPSVPAAVVALYQRFGPLHAGAQPVRPVLMGRTFFTTGQLKENNMRLKAIILFAMLSAALLAAPARAAIINTSIGTYDVTTILTSFRGSETLLKSQVWWENVPLAEEFATLVGTTFGTPNLGIYAPFFWQTDRDTTGPCAGIGEPFAGFSGITARVERLRSVQQVAPNGPFTFAVATPILLPEPGSTALLAFGLGALLYVRRRSLRITRGGGRS